MGKIVTQMAPTVHTPPPDEAVPAELLPLIPMDHLLARQVWRVLREHYPGWAWKVEVPAPFFGKPRDDLVIRNFDCDPRGRMGFYLRKSALSGGNLTQTVMRAGGEFLERYKMRRLGFRMEEVSDRRMIFERPDV